MTRKRQSLKRNKKRKHQPWLRKVQEKQKLNTSVNGQQEFNNSISCTPQKLNRTYNLNELNSINFVNNVNRPHKVNSNYLLPARKLDPITVDVATQTVYSLDLDHVQHFDSPFMNIASNVFHTPEKNKFVAPIPFGSSTPIRMERMLNKVKANEGGYSSMQCKEFTVNKQKLYNAITPKSHHNILGNCKNYNSVNNFMMPQQTLCNPQNKATTSPSLNPIKDVKENIEIFTSPITTKSWRSSGGRGRQLNKISRKQTPKLSKFFKLTNQLHKNYTVRMMVKACTWFKNTVQKGLFIEKMQENKPNESKHLDKEEILDKEKINENEQMFKMIKEELKALKNMINDLKTNREQVPQNVEVNKESLKVEPMEILKAPPPPPPPPPMPLPTQMIEPRRFAMAASKSKNNVDLQLKRGPVVSLEDLKQVKLKKPGERKFARIAKNDRSHSVPDGIFLNVLKPNRLRPISTLATLSNDSAFNGEKPCSESPASSLKRLLSNNAVGANRPKRIRDSLQGNGKNIMDRERFGIL